jgi:hypothetical protein
LDELSAGRSPFNSVVLQALSEASAGSRVALALDRARRAKERLCLVAAAALDVLNTTDEELREAHPRHVRVSKHRLVADPSDYANGIELGWGLDVRRLRDLCVERGFEYSKVVPNTPQVKRLDEAMRTLLRSLMSNSPACADGEQCTAQPERCRRRVGCSLSLRKAAEILASHRAGPDEPSAGALLAPTDRTSVPRCYSPLVQQLRALTPRQVAAALHSPNAFIALSAGAARTTATR